jgi:DNA-binding GntR family transcriptional regulator
MYQKGYMNGALEADVKFHETLINYTENKKLITAYFTSNIPLFPQKLRQSLDYMNDYELTDVEHRAIVSALANKDFPLAQMTLIKHLERGENTTFFIGESTL